MKKQTNGAPPSASAHTSRPSQPTKSKHTGFYQLSNLIPAHLIPGLERKYAIDSRGFNGNGHVLGLIYGHASHALSLNDICDALSLHAAEFFRVRGSTPPKRNTFSNANRTRNPAMAEELYWSMLAHLKQICPSFGGVSVRPTALPPRCDFAKIESSSGSVRGEIQPDVRRVSRRRAGARESVRTF